MAEPSVVAHFADLLLDVGGETVRKALFIPMHGLIVMLSRETTGKEERKIRVFDRGATGKPRLIFQQHQAQITGVVHPFGDVMAPLGSSGIIMKRRASSDTVVGWRLQ